MQTPVQQRRMTAPASSLQLPDGGYQPPRTGRPPSPLRNGILPNTFTGIDPHSQDSEDEDDDRAEWTRSPSPTSSVSQMAASFARSVTSLVGNMAPRSPGTMPTDAELEAEAERDRDRSRREAERILTKEAQDRKLVEERVLAMMESTKSLPPPPSRSQSLQDPPSPSSSQKESGGWWAAAKNRLTPTKDLTPAQQVIQEAKAREKEKKSTGKGKEKEWSANTQAKYTNPAFNSLVPPPQRSTPIPSSPTSPTPSRPYVPHANMPPNLTPSPMRHGDPSSSPREKEKETPPLYAHFDENTGTLDVHVTLLTIAKRFEKLEKWTVGHVRALEERMGDVERWLVDKENEKEQSLHEASSEGRESGNEAVTEIREGLQELQSRVSSLGREVAKLATAPANLSQSAQARYPAEVTAVPSTPSSFAVPTTSSPRVVSGHTARESTSPPMASSASAGSARLPYPTGDYASPPQSALGSHDVFAASPPSPTHSVKSRPVSGLPGIGTGATNMSTPASASSSYSNASFSTVSSISSGLPIPKSSPRSSGRASVSPTPRKRYTVALGGSVESDSESGPELGTAMFSGSEEEDFGGDTIGKSAAATKLSRGSVSGKTDMFSTPTVAPKEPRMRAQSAYGLSSILQASPTTAAIGGNRPAPLSHGRSRSIDRFGTGKFVDPLELRKQSGGGGKDAGKAANNGKVPVRQLAAFFDGDNRK
ncbi:hypothetical protein C8J57DRAFT_1121147 [Mycena rebaudengoi]|nr:hypothetical protein C8J57DRAFT_1121147 [Mycena rebaudengoi]